MLIKGLKPKTFLGAGIGIRILYTEIMLFMPYAKVDTRRLIANHRPLHRKRSETRRGRAFEDITKKPSRAWQGYRLWQYVIVLGFGGRAVDIQWARVGLSPA